MARVIATVRLLLSWDTYDVLYIIYNKAAASFEAMFSLDKNASSTLTQQETGG